MAGADQGDNRGLPADGEIVEQEGSPAAKAITQLLPLVSAQAAVDSPTIRAVARRSAAALPAIGRTTTSSPVPRSARATVDRKKRATPTNAGKPAGAALATSTSMDAMPAQSPTVSTPVPGVPVAQPSTAEPFQVQPAAEAAASCPASERTPAGEPVPGSKAEATLDPRLESGPTTASDSKPGPAEAATATAPASLAAPIEVESAGRNQPPDIVDAEVVSRAAGPVGRRSGLVLPPAQTDEWLQPHGVGTVVPPVARQEPAAAEIDVAPRRAVVRPGPQVLEADNWGIDPDHNPNNDQYHGRRRADTAGRRRWLLAALALIVVIGGIGVALLINSGSTPEASGRGGSTTSADDRFLSDAPTTAGELPSPGASLTGSPKPSTGSTLGPGVPTTSPTSTPTQSPTPPPFAPLSFEAENAARGGTAQVREDATGASNGRLVDRLGDDWGPGSRGWVEFSVGPIPSAGTYTVTIYYMFFLEPSESSRPVTLFVNGVQGETRSVASTTTCCQASSFDVTLNTGTNTIRFTHGSLKGPAIDRIVISKA
jgi:hypothetical protein